jgi:hypothetical protein
MPGILDVCMLQLVSHLDFREVDGSVLVRFLNLINGFPLLKFQTFLPQPKTQPFVCVLLLLDNLCEY